MCAIIGFLGLHVISKLSSFENALNILSHRGPDAKGIWKDKDILLGHRRLSIIDLTKTGHQPMIDEKTGSVLIFNGEIYNYKELSKELVKLGHQLIGTSDTEVLLHSLIEWGADVLPRLNGMWSFAFWSPQKKQLMLSRDRFGVKPLYVYDSNKRLGFASEPKALISLFPECKAVNEDTLLDFLGNNLLYSKGESFYKSISVFPPAHYGVYELNTNVLKLTRYWDYPKKINQNITEKEALEEFSNLFTDAVRLRLRSDVPLGVALSGGLDSSSILTAASKKSTSPITCFTTVYDEQSVDEYKWAKISANYNHSKLISVTAQQKSWLDTLKKISWHMDAPGYSPAVYPLWNLIKRSKSENILVLLDGQGADESLAGYPHYIINNLLEYLKKKNNQKITIKGFLSHVIRAVNTFGFRYSFAYLLRHASPTLHSMYRKRYGLESIILDGINISKISDQKKNKKYSVRDQLINDHSVNILPGLLHYGDSISMAHGVELRNPFLDYRLVEWIFKLPNHLLFNKSETKWVVREYLRNNNQGDIGNRLKKQGYPTPFSEWMNCLSDEIESLLLSNSNPLFKWFEKKKIKKIIDLNKKGVIGTDHHLYKLLSSRIWMQTCLYE
jgi:asparagine synthase (glutamine-hydrolysing)